VGVGLGDVSDDREVGSRMSMNRQTFVVGFTSRDETFVALETWSRLQSRPI